MTLDDEDQYESPAVIVPPGENVASFAEDGSVTMSRRKPDDRSLIWKGKKAIESCDDDKIKFICERPSGIVDYMVIDAHVIWRGSGDGPERQFVCLKSTHVVNDCPHTRRLGRYRDEHPRVGP